MNQNNFPQKKKGAKLLTLYKQHYLDQYSTPLDCSYSCWGYFDGMEISDVILEERSLFKKKSNAAISDVWYQTARNIHKQSGYFSQQNFGLFRCEDGFDIREEHFWNIDRRRIFMTVCFLQLKESIDTDSGRMDQIRIVLENLSDNQTEILTYFTFDNADLVLLLQSNSFRSITEKIKEIDLFPYVAYIHPINSVWEKSLDNFKAPEHEFKDASGSPLVNDPVTEIRINVVGKAGAFERKLRFLLDKTAGMTGAKIGQSLYAYMTGHENYVYYLRNTDMHTALLLLVPDGLLTHKNGLFGKKIYNMETQIQFEENNFADLLPEAFTPAKTPPFQGWCHRQLASYKQYMDNALKAMDEGLYSYCQTIIQTLNTLAQFESFTMSQNIFYIIYPAFRLFSKQLQSSCGEDFSKIMGNKNRKMIMNTIMDFLDSINNIVYHAIHMDQIFLMIPGYSGTSFSIPTKLSSFYLWFLNGISEILNDSDNQYGFYLTPVMESKPYTYLANFGFPPGDRLICVKVSQRSLFMPRALFLILTHETAHYVGNHLRRRETRWERIKRTIAAIMVETVLPEWLLEENKNRCHADRIHKKKKELYLYVKKELQRYFDMEDKSSSELYHTAMIQRVLKNACATILADENQKLKTGVEISLVERDTFQGSFEELLKLTEDFHQIARDSEIRRMEFLGIAGFDYIVDDIIKEYKEIFADLAALEILKFCTDDYHTAFNISEGYDVSFAKLPTLDYIRIRLIQSLTDKTTLPSSAFFPSNENRIPRNLLEYWPCLDVVEKHIKKYAEECQLELRKHIYKDFNNHSLEPGGSVKIQEIRKAMKAFSDMDMSSKEIYNFIDEKAKTYAKTVKTQLENECKMSHSCL